MGAGPRSVWSGKVRMQTSDGVAGTGCDADPPPIPFARARVTSRRAHERNHLFLSYLRRVCREVRWSKNANRAEWRGFRCHVTRESATMGPDNKGLDGGFGVLPRETASPFRLPGLVLNGAARWSCSLNTAEAGCSPPGCGVSTREAH